MQSVLRAVDQISRASGLVAAMIIIVLIVLMVYDAVLRYSISSPTIWAYEVGTYLMGASFVLSIAYALLHNAHVRVDLLYDWIPRRIMPYVDLIGFTLILLPTVLWITAGLAEYFYEGYVSGERSGGSAWNPRVWPFRLVLFVGFAIFALQLMAEIVRRAALVLGRKVEATPDSHELPT